MYIGRFLVVGPEGGAYRVSSRSFPHRQVVERDGTLAVVPTADAPDTDNPYVSYNCVRVAGDTAVLGNGSHVDPIAEKVGLGYPPRDALAESLLALDYERDDYDTPRIAGTVTTPDGADASDASDAPDAEDATGATGAAYVGIVRRDALFVQAVGEPTLVATYEKDAPEPYPLQTGDAPAAARTLYDAPFEHAVCAAGVAVADGGFETATYNGG